MFIAINQKGSTILEIVVATTIIGMVMTAIVVSLTGSLFASVQSEAKVTSSSLAQQALEVFYRERATQGWKQFEKQFSNNATYCLNSLPNSLATFPVTGSCSGTFVNRGLPVEFQREASIVRQNANQLAVTITVSWIENGNTRSTALKHIFRDIE